MIKGGLKFFIQISKKIFLIEVIELWWSRSRFEKAWRNKNISLVWLSTYSSSKILSTLFYSALDQWNCFLRSSVTQFPEEVIHKLFQSMSPLIEHNI